MKKCLALVLAVLMTMTLLTGCAQKAATSSAAASVQSASASAPAQSAASGAAQSPAGSSQSTAAESAPVTAGDEASLKARMNEIISDPEHPLAAAAIGVVKDGQIAFADAVGSKTIDNDDPSKNVPADGDTKYRIASISKLATAIAVWQLIEAGKIDPDKDASEYLGFTLRNPSYPDTPITVRMMMSHTSSIREDGDDAMYNIPLGHDVSEFFTPGKEYYCSGCWAPEGQAPGEYFSYANINYGLLGTIIERVSGERFDNYMTAHIFEPMGLSAVTTSRGWTRTRRSRSERSTGNTMQMGTMIPRTANGPRRLTISRTAIPRTTASPTTRSVRMRPCSRRRER